MSDEGEPRGARSRLVARNAAARTVGEIIAKLASVAFFVALARELGEGGFGDYAFALSLTTVLLYAAGFGTEELIAREVARHPDRVHAYLTDVLAIKLVLSVALLAVAAALVGLAAYPADVRLAVLLIGAAVALENLGLTWGAVFQALERMEFISIALILQRFTTAGVGIAVLLSGGGLIAVCLVTLGGALLGFFVGLYALSRYVVVPRFDLDRSRWLPLLRAGVPIGVLGVLLGGLIRIDQTLLSFLSDEPGNAEVGFFGAAFRLIEATMFIGWGFSAAMLPWFAQHSGDSGSDRLARGYELGLKATATVLVPVGLAFILFADPLIDLVYGNRYDPAIGPLRLLGVMVVLIGLNDLAAVLLIARDRPLAFARVVGLVVILNVGLNVVLIPEYGASGAAFTAAISALVLAVLGALVVRPLIGRVRFLRPYGASGAGALAMVGCVLGLGLPFVPAVVAGLAAYGAGYLAFEGLFYPDDLTTFITMLRRRVLGPPVEAA